MRTRVRAPGVRSVSRRTILKGLSLALAAGALPERPAWARRVDATGPARRCYIYLDHASRTQWVAGALLVSDPRLPRQLLHRAKRARLRRRTVPVVSARQTSDEFRRSLYQLMAGQRGFRKGLGQGLEVYSIRRDTAALRSLGDRLGAAQLDMVIALLDACRLVRFDEIFVHHNLPAFDGYSRGAFRTAVIERTPRRPNVRFEICKHRPWQRQPPGQIDPGLQLADFVVFALFQNYEYGNAQWFSQIRELVLREVDAGLDPTFRSIAAGV